MASISPITDALGAPFNNSPVQAPTHNVAGTPSTQAAAASAHTTAAASAATAAPTPTAGTTTQQPLNVVFDALASAGFDSTIGFNEELFTPPTAQAEGAFSIFMDQLLSALAAQQAAAAQTQTGPTSVANDVSSVAAAATQPATATATAAFVSNSSSEAPNSTLEGNVQALANQVQANGTATTAGTLAPLQQSFNELIATTGATASATALPTFLQSLAGNLHNVPSSLGNLVDSVT